jgi:hypothetical protein
MKSSNNALFCVEPNNATSKRTGNLVHLHLYCTSPTLINVRAHCHNKIESAIHDLYDFASRREYNLPFQECSRITSLQENLEKTALDLEKQERYIVRDSYIVLEARSTNKAVLQRSALNIAVLLKKVPAEKIQEYHTDPLTFQLGFIHSLSEDEFNIATITDVGFLGLIPKALLHILYQYPKEIK